MSNTSNDTFVIEPGVWRLIALVSSVGSTILGVYPCFRHRDNSCCCCTLSLHRSVFSLDNCAIRSSGRPLTGFQRSGTGVRPMSGKAMDLTTAMAGSRPATSRPLTSMGRYIA